MPTQCDTRWLQTYRLPFTWSHSRDQVYRLCQRQYYLRYYAPYGGNSPEEEGDRALFYLLGRLTSIPALIGNTVHRVACDALQAARAGRPWEAGVYTATADLLLRRAITRSQKGCSHPARNVQRQTVMLQEHYYQQPLDEMRAYAHAKDYSEALQDHPAFQRALANAQHLMLVDEVRRFDVGGVPIYCVPDVLMELPKGYYRLVDWKTGNAVADNLDASRRQLAIYALYIQQVEGAQPEAIHCEVADLRHRTVYHWQLTRSDLEEARERVLKSIMAMQQRLHETNSNQAVQDDYPQTSKAGAGEGPCVWCAYRRVCFGQAV